MTTSSPTVHLIGNAHLDPAWLWRWHEGYVETLGLTRTAIRLMDEFPEYTFVRSSAQAYAWIKEADPKLFEQVKAAVQRGQWDIVGGWWEQPDDNLPSAESFNRQALYGQRFFQKEFGRLARVGYCVDSFGHCAGFPALLKAAGMDGFVFTRPSDKWLKHLPPIFEWVSPDGSSIVGMHSPTNSYGTWSEDMATGLSTAAAAMQAEVGHVQFMYGWGDHGGGPTRANLLQLKAIMAGEYDKAVELGASAESIDKLKALIAEKKVGRLQLSHFTRLLEATLPQKKAGELPKLEGEIQYHSQGCYTSCSNIKYAMRQLENELFRAESALVAAVQLGVIDDVQQVQADIDEAWRSLLYLEFHDISAGSAYPPAVDDSMLQFGHGRYLADRAVNRAVQAMFQHVDASRMGWAHFFYNPLPWPVKRLLPLRWAPCAYDAQGNPVAYQKVMADSFMGATNSPSVTLTTLPACGSVMFYNERSAKPSIEPAEQVLCAGPLHEEARLLRQRAAAVVDPGAAAAAGNQIVARARAADASTCRLENDLLTARWNDDGHLSSIGLKCSGVELLSGPVVPLVIEDLRDAWGTKPEEGDALKWDKILQTMECRSARIKDEGPLLGTVRCEYVCPDGKLWIDYMLVAGTGHLDARVEILWHGRHKMIKLAVPLAVENPAITYDTPLAPVTRPADGIECPGQKWVDGTGVIGEKPAGLAIANDGKYGYSAVGREIRLTLLRSAHMAWMGADLPPARTPWHYMDQGLQRFNLRFIPHDGGWQTARIPQLAMELNTPPFVVHGGTHPGERSPEFSLLQIDPPTVIPLAIKRPEEGEGTILRLWQSTAEKTTAQITLSNQRIQIPLNPLQMKTLRLTSVSGRLHAEELNTLEES